MASKRTDQPKPANLERHRPARNSPDQPEPAQSGPARPHRSRMRHAPMGFLGFLSLMSMRKLRDWAVIMKPAS